MATDAADSGPLLEEIFTDDQWDANFVDGMGIINDTDGSAFKLNLPPATDVAEIGSTTVESNLVAAGRGLTIAMGATQSLEIPAALTGGTTGRTDLIVARCDLEDFDEPPGPVRLHRIEGTPGSLSVPAYDPKTDLRLYAVRRRQGEGLNQTIVTDMRQWMGRSILVRPGTNLPASPLGTRAARDGVVFLRDMVGSAPDWVEQYRARVSLTGGSATEAFGEGFSRQDECRMDRLGKARTLHYAVKRTGFAFSLPADGRQILGLVHDEDKPAAATATWTGQARTTTNGFAACGGIISRATCRIYLDWVSTTALLGPAGPDNTIAFDAHWHVQ